MWQGSLKSSCEGRRCRLFPSRELPTPSPQALSGFVLVGLGQGWGHCSGWGLLSGAKMLWSQIVMAQHQMH